MTDSPTGAAAWLRARWPCVAAGAVVVGLVVWTFVVRYRFLMSSDYPVGIDGYFYPIQLRSLLETGELYYPSSPLTFWLMTPLAAVTDPMTGAKIGAALGTSLIGVPVYFLGRRISGDRAIGVLAAALATTSAESFYLTGEFVKNGVGLTVAAFYLASLLWMLDRPKRGRILVAAALLAATFLAHKMAAAIALAATAPPVWVAWVELRRRGVSARDHSAKIALGVGVALIGVVVVLGALAPDRFLSLGDASLFGGMFTSELDLTMPALHVSGGRALRFGHEVPIAAALATAALGVALVIRRKPELGPGISRDRAIVLVPALIALLAAIPWLDIANPQALPFRIRLVVFLPLALCAALVAAAVLSKVSASTRTALVIGFAVGWIASRPPTSNEGMVWVKPVMKNAIASAADVVPDDHVVICPQRSLVYMYTWYSGKRARLRPEEVASDKRWRLIPSALFDRKTGEVVRALDRVRAEKPEGVPPPIGLIPQRPNGVVLMPEATWQWVLKQLNPHLRRWYQRWQTI